MEERKIKVLITVNNSVLSGIERFVLLLTELINKDKYSITVGVPSFGPFCEILEEYSVNYFIFNEPGKKPFSFNGIYNIFKHLISYKYDIVHSQAGIAPCILAKILGCRLVVEHKHGLDYTHEKRNNIGLAGLMYEKVKKYFTDCTMTVCETDKKYLISKFGYNQSKVVTLYNGIKRMDKHLHGVTRKNNLYAIGTVGRLTYQKGQEYFIEMADLLLKECGRNDLVFEIWGDGENRNYYASLINKYKLNDYVKLMGYAHDSIDVYSRFDIFVLTARYEGIPFVVLEAMRAKLPLVATDVGGIHEVIKNNYNGILVEKENPEKLKGAVMKLLDNVDIAKTMADNAYADFQEKWTAETMIQRLEKIYEKFGNF